VREQRLGATGMATQHGADARGELVELERLDDVVVGAGIEPGDAIAARVARSDDDHRRRVAAAAQFAQHAETVRGSGRGAARQAEIEQHEIEALARERRGGGGGVANPVDGEALEAKRTLQALADHAIVFDEQ